VLPALDAMGRRGDLEQNLITLDHSRRPRSSFHIRPA
jgi:hypothetical protein